MLFLEQARFVGHKLNFGPIHREAGYEGEYL